MTNKTKHPSAVRRVSVRVDNDIPELMKALRDRGINPNDALRRELRSAMRDPAKTASAIRRKNAARKPASFFSSRCGDKCGATDRRG